MVMPCVAQEDRWRFLGRHDDITPALEVGCLHIDTSLAPLLSPSVIPHHLAVGSNVVTRIYVAARDEDVTGARIPDGFDLLVLPHVDQARMHVLGVICCSIRNFSTGTVHHPVAFLATEEATRLHPIP